MSTVSSPRIFINSLALLMAALSNTASAAGWLDKSQVSRVTVHDWGDAVFIHTATAASPENCSGGKNPLVLLRSHPQFKEIYAVAMTAIISKSTIGGYTNGCDPGHYNLPLLVRIDLLADHSTSYPQ
jgi:hypothetical protein